MSEKLRKVVEDPKFIADFKAISAKHPRATEFLAGVRFAVERDPTEGNKWGKVWYWSSARGAKGLPLMTVFYTFDDETVRLLAAIETALM